MSWLLLVVFASLTGSLASSVPAAALPSRAVAYVDKTGKEPSPAKNAGSIDGQVLAVDYGQGNITVKAAGGRYEIVVLPSTSIQGRNNNNFHTIADIHKGAHVQVIMSQKAGTYTAQIIKLY